MSYLLDTNVVSESERPAPDKNVIKWLGQTDPDDTYLSALTVGEIKKGVSKLQSGRRKVHIQTWLDVVRKRFGGRILSLTEETFSVWGKMMAEFERKGIVRPALDSLLEATALEHDLVLVTRNVKNFKDSHVTILNPWEG